MFLFKDRLCESKSKLHACRVIRSKQSTKALKFVINCSLLISKAVYFLCLHCNPLQCPQTHENENLTGLWDVKSKPIFTYMPTTASKRSAGNPLVWHFLRCPHKNTWYEWDAMSIAEFSPEYFPPCLSWEHLPVYFHVTGQRQAREQIMKNLCCPEYSPIHGKMYWD